MPGAFVPQPYRRGLDLRCPHAGRFRRPCKWRIVTDPFRPRVPKLATLMDAAGDGALAHLHLAVPPWAKLHSANRIKRFNGKMQYRIDVVGITLGGASLIGLAGGGVSGSDLLSDDAWAVMGHHLLKGRHGAHRADGHRAISGIVNVMRSGCRWRGGPPELDPTNKRCS